MNSARFEILPLAKIHDRAHFCCGNTLLDHYFQHQVMQDTRRRVTTCFIALSHDQAIAGYYTLASTGIALKDLPATQSQKLPRYPLIPAINLGRLAVDKTFQQQGLGSALLFDALQKAAHASIAAYAMTVDAKDSTASQFYQHHGFIPLLHSPLQLFLPLATVSHLLQL